MRFAERTERIPGLLEVGVVGSATTDTVEPGDLDFAVFLGDHEALPAVAKKARRLSSLSQRWSVWVFEGTEHRFLGWVGVRKAEPLVVGPDFEFDERKFMRIRPRVRLSRSGARTFGAPGTAWPRLGGRRRNMLYFGKVVHAASE